MLCKTIFFYLEENMEKMKKQNEKGSLTIVGNANSNVKASLDGSTLTINMEWEEWT